MIIKTNKTCRVVGSSDPIIFVRYQLRTNSKARKQPNRPKTKNKHKKTKQKKRRKETKTNKKKKSNLLFVIVL